MNSLLSYSFKDQCEYQELLKPHQLIIGGIKPNYSALNVTYIRILLKNKDDKIKNVNDRVRIVN